MDYDDWLTEMLIKHGVDRPHAWEKHKYNREAIDANHWEMGVWRGIHNVKWVLPNTQLTI